VSVTALSVTAQTDRPRLPISSRTAPDEVDLFFVVDGDLLLYLIPASVAAGRTTLSLGAYRDFIVGDASSLLHSLDPTLGSGASPLRPAS
jgi:hypothetical protein